MTNVFPTALALDGNDVLVITWSDHQTQRISVQSLRDRCPCATCREKHTRTESGPELLPVLTTEQLQPLRILGMRPIGSYAYGIDFSDGHNSGIFTFEYLREMPSLDS